jgi:hypothetical protein
MKLRFPVVAPLLYIALAFAGTGVHAQSTPTAASVGLYFNPDVTIITNSIADTSDFAFLGTGSKSAVFGGVEFGGYYEFSSASKYTVALDMRDAIRHGNSASINSFLVGVRVATKPLAFAGIKPYVQVSVGAGRTKSPYNPVHKVDVEVDGFVGVDKPLGKHVDWRIAELGYGSLTTVSISTEPGQPRGEPTIPAAKLFDFSTGFVFRFP